LMNWLFINLFNAFTFIIETTTSKCRRQCPAFQGFSAKAECVRGVKQDESAAAQQNYRDAATHLRHGRYGSDAIFCSSL
ncbi:MAG: hypothetical protein ACXW3M_07085, partial [Rhodoplanes sp.]